MENIPTNENAFKIGDRVRLTEQRIANFTDGEIELAGGKTPLTEGIVTEVTNDDWGHIAVDFGDRKAMVKPTEIEKVE